MRAAGSGRPGGDCQRSRLPRAARRGRILGVKTAAISYLESLRVKLRTSGINVITICPGYIATPDDRQQPLSDAVPAEVRRPLRKISPAL